MVNSVRDELEAASRLGPYAGFELAYVCLIKLSLSELDERDFNSLSPVKRESRRLFKMVARLPEERMREILELPQVDGLLSINPPLGTYRSHEKEEIYESDARRGLKRIRLNRTSDPREALGSLMYLLKMIRNKREHGFKSPNVARDQAILAPAYALVVAMAKACLDLPPSSEPAGGDA